MKHLIFLFMVASFSLATLASCDKDENPQPDPEPEPKVEQIASYLKLSFKPVGDTITPPILYPYVNLELEDGRWGNYTSGLKRNKTYEVSLIIEDRRTSPVKDIYKLIESKPDEYQFFIKSNEEYVVFEALDKDSKGFPVGLIWKATVKDKTTLFSNSYEIILIHAPGTKNGTTTVGKKVIDLRADQSIL
jgi:hypothetical protein